MKRSVEKSEESVLGQSLQACLQLAPTVLGLMRARIAIIVSTYGSYTGTDAGLYTDGSSLVALVPMFALLCFLGIGKARFLSKRVIFWTTTASIVAQSACILGEGVLCLLPGSHDSAVFALCAGATLASWLCILYWLRRARGASSCSAVIIAFGSLLLSEPVIYLSTLVPRCAACFAVGALSLTQFLWRLQAHKQPLPVNIDLGNMAQGYFSFAEKMVDSVRFLGVLALGTFIISAAIGLLRGFPDGQAIAFGPFTRVAYMLLAIALFAFLIYNALAGIRNVMTTFIWIAMQTCGIVALLLYAIFPDMLDVGAVFTTVLNVTMTGFMWYLVIAFSSHGNRDAYYYGVSGWMAFLLPRSLGRIGGGMAFAAFPAGDALITAVVALLLLLSAQSVFLQFLWLANHETHSAEEGAGGMQRLLGLEGSIKDSAGIRRALMQKNTEQMKQQFLLSDRETEVLTLYALGLTQSKIAEELYISPGTAHTHIKRIYAKCNLHSRQEILDYIERYTQ